MAATIRDVAKQAGVSVSTVSKALSGNYSISAATKDKINRVINELNYRPNIIAKSFARQNSYNIGVIMNLSHYDAFIMPHLYEILAGIETTAHENGYFLTFSNIKSKKDKHEIIETLAAQKVVNGLILHVDTISRDICRELDSLKFPYIVIGQPDFSYHACWVDINNKLAGEIAVNHLVEEGYKKIAFIGGMSDDRISRDRLDGYKNSLTKHGMNINENYIKTEKIDVDTSFNMACGLLEMQDPPDSIVCSNNFAALGCLRAVMSKGLKVPEDAAIITFDNYPFSQFTEPPLSVVEIDVFELGVHAANALINKLKNPNLQIEYSMLSPTLNIRESTRKAPDEHK